MTRKRKQEDLAPLRTIAMTFAAFIAACATFAKLGSSPVWLTTPLSVVALIALGIGLVLSVYEWLLYRQAGPSKPFPSRRLLLVSIIALTVATAALVVFFKDTASRTASDVHFDHAQGTGPYSVNGTCVNKTCVLYERSAPSAQARKVARLKEGQLLTIVCQTKGEMLVHEGKPASDIWDRLYNPQSGPYVSDYFTNTPATGTFSPRLKRCQAGS